MIESAIDIELPDWSVLDRHVPGYPMLSSEMQNRPTLNMFRRFGALNARNLLYLQSELLDLENELKKIEYCDSVGNEKRPLYAKDCKELYTSNSPQWNLFLRIKEKLKEYNEALLQQHFLQNIPKPDKYDQADILDFIFTSKKMNNPFTAYDRYIWGVKGLPGHDSPDLIALKSRRKEDKFSNIVATYAIQPLHWCFSRFKPGYEKGQVLYQDGTVMKITYWMNGAVASIVPIACIFALYKIDTVERRIAASAGFNVLAALVTQIFTNATRGEVFAVVAM
ncbi:hypothetical protein DM02DRAFT_695345 [Periconia macrospinosa]|uniref:DUF6594 domain-containing protein n=1 Tax=Periconia macrospinosa TaxID=97972 RepID=A0A2V1D6I0_9PLEO|nr:hypothetical protein DM02DRAFT_695345 [Periconia macrospinosa]